MKRRMMFDVRFYELGWVGRGGFVRGIGRRGILEGRSEAYLLFPFFVCATARIGVKLGPFAPLRSPNS